MVGLTLIKENEMLTLEWMRVTDPGLEQGRSHLVKYGHILSGFLPSNTRMVHFSSQKKWLIDGEHIETPNWVLAINSMKHKAAPEKLSIGDKVHITNPRTQQWTGIIVAKRNLSEIWVVKDGAGFGVDVDEKHLTKAM